MIEALKSDEIVNKVGGRFKLTALIQRRMLELMDGARPLVDRDNLTDLEVVIQEILQEASLDPAVATGMADQLEAFVECTHRGDVPSAAEQLALSVGR